MNINKILPFSFKGKIIDVHTHIGTIGKELCTKEQLDVFVKEPLPNQDSVEKMIVSDLDILLGSKKEYEGNIELKKQLMDDSHYAFLASCSPQNGNAENIEKLFMDNPNSFLGLKFHSYEQKLAPSNEKYKPYMEFAAKYNLPCLFHTAVYVDDNGKLLKETEPYSDPELVYDLAKKYPQTPVILAHLGAGWGEAHDKAIDVLMKSIQNKDANLYADISWVDIDSEYSEGHSIKPHIIKAIKNLKGIGKENWSLGDQSFRLMFGTDAPLARFSYSDARQRYAGFVEDIKFAIRNDSELKESSEQIIEDLFYNNAKKLFSSHK